MVNKDMKNICLPNDFPTQDQMLDVLKKTIEKSWKADLNNDDIDLWLSNFTGLFYDVEIERRLALWLLCNFTYYNEDDVNHLCRMLFKNLLHALMVDNNLKTESDAESYIQGTAFTSIGKASESGGLLLYHFRQESHLDISRFIFPTEETELDTIVCIDDVMMSGGTAMRFFYKHQDTLRNKKIYYITLLTTEEAVNALNNLNINVIYCALLDSRNQMFSDNSLAFYKYPELKDFAKEMAEGYGKQIEPQKALGHKNGQYSFGLYYNIPNNSLPIFWSNRNNWHPILCRKEKYQNAKQANRKYSYFI